MAKPQKLAAPGTVNEYLAQLGQPLRAVAEAARQTILSATPEVGEQIKWNSPSYYYTGEMPPFEPKEYRRDIVVMNLHRGYVLLVFPSGAKIPNPPALLEGSYADGRRLVSIRDLADAQAKAPDLQQVIQLWLNLIEK